MKKVKKLVPALLIIACMLFAIACGSKNAESVTLSENSIQLKIGQEHTLTATVLPDKVKDKTVEWSSDNEDVATVDGGLVKALAKGNATITASINGMSAYCQVGVIEEEEGYVDDERRVDGYIYHETFDERTEAPKHLGKVISGAGKIELLNDEEDPSNGYLKLSTPGGSGTAFADYYFENDLSGILEIETKLKVDKDIDGETTAFSNLIFFYKNTAEDPIACIAIDGGNVKYHNGSGWTNIGRSYTYGEWLTIKMILDTGSAKYTLYINGTAYPNIPFRRVGDGTQDRIKILRFGSDKTGASMTYDYIMVSQASDVYSPEIQVVQQNYLLLLSETRTLNLLYTYTGIPLPTISISCDKPDFVTISENKKTLTFSETAPLGDYRFTVRAENEVDGETKIDEKVFTVTLRESLDALLQTDFSAVPGGMQLTNGNGSASVSGGKLNIDTEEGSLTSQENTSMSSAVYDFGAPLAGKILVETAIENRSNASANFMNILYLYKAGSNLSSTSDIAVSMAIQNNNLQYNNGSSWVTLKAMPKGEYKLQVVLDFNTAKMNVWLNYEKLGNDLSFRNSGLANNAQILLIGSDKKNASFSYDYLNFTKLEGVLSAPSITVPSAPVSVDVEDPNQNPYTLDYTVLENGLDTLVTITCDKASGFTIDGDVVNFTTGGTYIFTITAVNIGGTATKTITVEVSALNQAPTLTITSAKNIEVSLTEEYTLTYTFTGSPLPEFSISADKTSGYNADLTAGKISFSKSGAYTFTLRATNTVGTASESFTLTVLDPYSEEAMDRDEIIKEDFTNNDKGIFDETVTASATLTYLDGKATFARSGSGNAWLTYTFSEALSGTFMGEVKFQSNDKSSDQHQIVYYIETQSLSRQTSITVRNNILSYNINNTWYSFSYNGNAVELVDEAWYILRVVTDTENKAVYVYLSGTDYLVGGVSQPFGNDVFLGKIGYRVSSATAERYRAGMDGGTQKFTIDYVNFYQLTPASQSNEPSVTILSQSLAHINANGGKYTLVYSTKGDIVEADITLDSSKGVAGTDFSIVWDKANKTAEITFLSGAENGEYIFTLTVATGVFKTFTLIAGSAPEFTLEPVGGAVNLIYGTHTISFTISDDDADTVLIADKTSGWVYNSANKTITFSNTGTYEFTIYAENSVGSDSAVFTVVVSDPVQTKTDGGGVAIFEENFDGELSALSGITTMGTGGTISQEGEPATGAVTFTGIEGITNDNGAWLIKDLGGELTGIVVAEVRFTSHQDLTYDTGLYDNLFFMVNDPANALLGSGASKRQTTIALNGNTLKYNVGGWQAFKLNGNNMVLVPNTEYTLRVVTNTQTKKVYVYLTGEKYIVDSVETALGENAYLGVINYRNDVTATHYASGLTSLTSFTLSAVNFYKLGTELVINQRIAPVSLDDDPNCTLDYTAKGYTSLEIECDKDAGFERTGNDISFTEIGTYVFTITLTSPFGTSTGTITVNVTRGLSITITSSQSADIAVNGVYNLTYTITPVGASITDTTLESDIGIQGTDWTYDTSTKTITALRAGTYVFTLTVTDDNESSASADFTVVVHGAPEISLNFEGNQTASGFPATFTLSADKYTITSTVPTYTVSVSYTQEKENKGGWFYNSTTNTITFNASGTFYFTATVQSMAGTDTADFVVVASDPREVLAEEKTVIFEEDFASGLGDFTQPSGHTTNGSAVVEEGKLTITGQDGITDNNAIWVVKDFGGALSGTIMTEMSFTSNQPQRGDAGLYDNLFFMMSNANGIETATTRQTTIAISANKLSYNVSGWKVFKINGNDLVLKSGEKYTLRAITDLTAKKVYVYISGAIYLNGSNELPLGENVYLGEIGFRNDVGATHFGIGTSKITSFSVDYVNFYQLDPSINITVPSKTIVLSEGSASYTLEYTSSGATTTEITCATGGFAVNGNEVSFTTAGTHTVNIKVSNKFGYMQKTVTIIVVDGIAITLTTEPLKYIAVGGAYTFDYEIIGSTSTPVLSCTEDESGTNWTLNEKTITFSQKGTYNFTLMLTEGSYTDTATFVVHVHAKPIVTIDLDSVAGGEQTTKTLDSFPASLNLTDLYNVDNDGLSTTESIYGKDANNGGWFYNTSSKVITFNASGTFVFTLRSTSAVGFGEIDFTIIVVNPMEVLPSEKTLIFEEDFANGFGSFTTSGSGGTAEHNSTDGTVTLSGNSVWIVKDFGEALTGMVLAEIDFVSNQSQTGNDGLYDNIFFMLNGIDGIGTANKRQTTISVRANKLYYCIGSTWSPFKYNNKDVILKSGEKYTLRVITDIANKKVYVYLSGDVLYVDANTTEPFGENVYLGEIGFRNDVSATHYAAGMTSATEFTLDSVKFYQLEPSVTINKNNEMIALSSGSASYTLDYDAHGSTSTTITCDKQSGFTINGNEVTFTTADTYTFTVSVQNKFGSTSKNITVTVVAGISIVLNSEDSATTNSSGGIYQLDYTAVGLITGTTLVSDFGTEDTDWVYDVGTKKITFNTKGTYNFTLTISDENESKNVTFTVTVYDNPVISLDLDGDPGTGTTTQKSIDDDLPVSFNLTGKYTIDGDGLSTTEALSAEEENNGGWFYNTSSKDITFNASGTFVFTLRSTSLAGFSEVTFTIIVNDTRIVLPTNKTVIFEEDFTSGLGALVQTGTGTGTATVNDGKVTVDRTQSSASGNVWITKTFDSELTGVFMGEIKFQSNIKNSDAGPYQNIFFLQQGTGTSDRQTTISVRQNNLLYNNGGWKMFQYNGKDLELKTDEWYILRVISDTAGKKVYVYLSGAVYMDGNVEKGFGNDVFLGMIDFRNENAKALAYTAGMDSSTKFTLDYVNFYQIEPVITVGNALDGGTLSEGTAQVVLDYTVANEISYDIALTSGEASNVTIDEDKKTVTFTATGTYVFTITAHGTLGRTKTEIITVTIIEDGVDAPEITLNFTGTQTAAALPGKYVLDYTVESTIATIDTVTKTSGSGDVTFDAATKTLTFSAPDTYELTLTSTSTAGEDTETFTITVEDALSFALAAKSTESAIFEEDFNGELNANGIYENTVFKVDTDNFQTGGNVMVLGTERESDKEQYTTFITLDRNGNEGREFLMGKFPNGPLTGLVLGEVRFKSNNTSGDINILAIQRQHAGDPASTTNQNALSIGVKGTDLVYNGITNTYKNAENGNIVIETSKWYILRVIIDQENKQLYVYLTGENIGENILIGNHGFRDNSHELYYYMAGMKTLASASIDYVNFYQLNPTILNNETDTATLVEDGESAGNYSAEYEILAGATVSLKIELIDGEGTNVNIDQVNRKITFTAEGEYQVKVTAIGSFGTLGKPIIITKAITITVNAPPA